MQDIVVEFDVRFAPGRGNLISKFETNPKLYCYLSGHVQRNYKNCYEVPMLNDEDWFTGTISGSAPLGGISSNLAFCVALFADRKDSTTGVSCKIALGTGRFLLENFPANGTERLPIVMHTVDNHVKAVVEIRLSQKTMNRVKQLRFDSVVFKPETMQADLAAYYDAIQKMKEDLGDTIPGTSNMDAPYDFSEAGFGLANGIRLPFLSFALRDLPVTNAEMWENSLEIVLARDGFHLEDFDQLGADGKARVMANMMTLIPSYYDYTADIILKDTKYDNEPRNNIGIEQFSSSMARITGSDCEDDGNFIATLHMAFCGFCFQLNTELHIKLRELQAIARNYIGFRSLEVVRGQQVADKVGYGAHLNCNFISFAMLKAGLLRHPGGQAIVDALSWPEGMSESTVGFPLMVGEGTGLYEPLGVTETETLLAKGLVYQLPSVANLKKWIGHARSESTAFFVAALIGVMDYFVRNVYQRKGVIVHKPRAYYGSFFFTNGDKTAPSRGTYYSDFVSDNKDKYGFIIMPPLSEKIMQGIREAAAIDVPPDPVVLDRRCYSGKEDDPKFGNTHLDQLVAAIDRMRIPEAAKHVTAPIFIREHHLTDKLVQQMIAEFSAQPRIYRVSYHLELITNQVWGYRVQVHVNIQRN